MDEPPYPPFSVGYESARSEFLRGFFALVAIEGVALAMVMSSEVEAGFRPAAALAALAMVVYFCWLTYKFARRRHIGKAGAVGWAFLAFYGVINLIPVVVLTLRSRHLERAAIASRQ